MKSHGFTLIELLIVVALLGVLALGLLATIDPFEQLKKGTDTSRRNTTSEVYNSMLRFYATKSSFPWTTDINGMQLSDSAMTSAPNGYINQVLSAGELKQDFISLAGSANLGKIFLTSTAVNGSWENITLCFLPESKSFAAELNSKYAVNGAISSGCRSTSPGGNVCYWCIK